jgi:hypothetical protein
VTVSAAYAGDQPVVPKCEQKVAADSDVVHETERPADVDIPTFDREHARLYDALKVAQERAELAGHDGQAADLRQMRETVARHVHFGLCLPRQA